MGRGASKAGGNTKATGASTGGGAAATTAIAISKDTTPNDVYSKETADLLFGLPESERKTIYYQKDNTMFPQGVGEEGRDKPLGSVFEKNPDNVSKYEQAAKENNVLVNMDAPKLSGTERQVSYANDLIKQGVRNDIRRLEDNYSNSEKRKSAVRQLSNGGVKDINTFNDAVNYVVKNGANSTFGKIKGMTSAHDVIEKLRRGY